MSSYFSEADRRNALPLGATVLALALVTFGSTACQPQGQGQQAAVDTTQILSTFRDTLPQAFEAAVKAGDFDAQARIYTENALYSHPRVPPVRGRDSIRALFERVTPLGATADIRPMDTQILSPNWVADFGTVTFTFTPEGAKEPTSIENTYFALFHRTDEGWKIVWEALSSNAPPPGAQ